MSNSYDTQRPDEEYTATCGCVFDRLEHNSFLVRACPFALSVMQTPSSHRSYADSAYHTHLEEARDELALILDRINSTDTSRSP